MGPEKFISMLDDLKEKLKSKGNEIAHLREQLKTSELDAKRYKNDGIQDRVKLQEVTEELEKVKKLMDTPCKDVKELIDNLIELLTEFLNANYDLSNLKGCKSACNCGHSKKYFSNKTTGDCADIMNNGIGVNVDNCSYYTIIENYINTSVI